MADLNSQISGYDEEIQGYEKSILENQLASAKAKAQANEPKSTSLQDALISAVINVVPGILGYAASGKAGGAVGLQAGLGGGALYNQKLDDNYEAEKGKNLALAESADLAAKTALSSKEKLETRKFGLEDWDAKFEKSEAGRNARNARSASSNNAIASSMAQFLASQGGDVTGQTSEASGSSLTTLQQGVYDFLQTPEGKEEFAQNPDAYNKILTATGKVQGLQKGEQGVVKGEQEIAAGASERDSAMRPLDTGTGIVLPPKNGWDSDALVKNREVSTKYSLAMQDLTEMGELVNKRGAFERVTDDEALAKLKDLRASLSGKIRAIYSSTEEDPSRAESAAKRIMERIPQFGSLGAEVSNKVGSLFFTPSFSAQLKSLQESFAGEIEGTFKNTGGRFISKSDLNPVKIKDQDGVFILDEDTQEYVRIGE